MIFKTTPTQDRAVADCYRTIAKAHHEEDCAPPGYLLQVEMGLPSHFSPVATAICGCAILEIGEIEVIKE